MDLRGSLHSTDLPMLVRFLASLETSGRLRVTHGTRRGELYFECGRITAAAFGESRGLAALDAIAATLRDGRFTFERGALPPTRELDLTPNALGARLDALAGPVPAQGSPGRTDGVAAAGATARTLRDQLRQRPAEAPPAGAVVAPEVPAEQRPRAGPKIGGGVAVVALVGLVGLGAVGVSVLLAAQDGRGLAPPQLASNRAPAVVAPGAAPAPAAAPGNPAEVAPSGALTASVQSAPATQVLPLAPVVPSDVPGARSVGGIQAATLPDRVAAAEADLRSGRFEVTVRISDASRSTATVLFDLGGGAGGIGAPRLRMTSTYIGPAGTQATDQIVVGESGWDRVQGGGWTAVPHVHSPWFQVTGLLPRAGTAVDPEVTTGPDGAVLRWYEAGYDADVTLRVDPATGVPREFRRVTRATGTVLDVAYTAWNVPVDISPPQG